MSLKNPATLIVITTAALSTACSMVEQVPSERHPISSTVALEATSTNCLKAGHIDNELQEQIQNDADVLRFWVGVSPENYANRLDQAMQTAAADPETCGLVAEYADDLKRAAERFADHGYPRGPKNLAMETGETLPPSGVITGDYSGSYNAYSWGNTHTHQP